MKQRKLNIGGQGHVDGWEVLNANAAPYVDHVHNAIDLGIFEESAFDLLYASHILQHFDYVKEVAQALKEWHRVLRPGGLIFISVPDLEVLANLFVDKESLSSNDRFMVMRMIYGGHTDKYDYHYTGFNEEILAEYLKEAGFQRITRVKEFGLFHDMSTIRLADQAISLNVIAEKSKIKVQNNILETDSTQFSVKSDQATCDQLKKIGNKLLQAGDFEAAENCYRKILFIDDKNLIGLINLGFVLKTQKKYGEAEFYLRQALSINSSIEDIHYLLGGVALETKSFSNAISFFENAIQANPDLMPAYLDLCNAYYNFGKSSEAERILKEGLKRFPEESSLYGYEGNLAYFDGDLEKAVVSYRKAISLEPKSLLFHANLGKAFQELALIEDAKYAYTEAKKIGPSNIQTASCLLFLRTLDPNNTAKNYYEEALAVGHLISKGATPYSSWKVERAPSTKLRIGLVSGDFRKHPVGYFLESVLPKFDLNQFQLFAYASQEKNDALSERIKKNFYQWQDIQGLNDKTVAQIIHDDSIHILVDLSGHTAHNRLGVFAWKPAPVQVSWLGYLATTGVSSIDYLLADPVSVPLEDFGYFTEKVWHLPETINCLAPLVNKFNTENKRTPAISNGYVTFGSYQNLAKLNDEVLHAWGKILTGLPASKLRIHCKQMELQSARERLVARLSKVGIGADRVVFSGMELSRERYLQSYAEADIILDSFPYPGITTTCEALGMGVPVLTLSGSTMLSRQGAVLLGCVGMQDWIAYDLEDYISRAIEFGGSIQRIAEAREILQSRVHTSSIFDTVKFARNLQDAFRRMWARFPQNTKLG